MTKLKRLDLWAEILVKHGKITLGRIQQAEKDAGASGMSLEDQLEREGLVEMVDIQQAKAEQLGIDFVDIANQKVPAHAFVLLKESMARELNCLVYDVEPDLAFVAIGDPRLLKRNAELRFLFDKRVKMALADPQAIKEKICQLYYKEPGFESAGMLFSEF